MLPSAPVVLSMKIKVQPISSFTISLQKNSYCKISFLINFNFRITRNLKILLWTLKKKGSMSNLISVGGVLNRSLNQFANVHFWTNGLSARLLCDTRFFSKIHIFLFQTFKKQKTFFLRLCRYWNFDIISNGTAVTVLVFTQFVKNV